MTTTFFWNSLFFGNYEIILKKSLPKGGRHDKEKIEKIYVERTNTPIRPITISKILPMFYSTKHHSNDIIRQFRIRNTCFIENLLIPSLPNPP